MALTDIKVYYLEMWAHPGRIVPTPRDGLFVLHARKPSVAYYRFLYNTVGREYHWHSRGKLSDEKLGEILANPANEMHVLYVEGSPAGFAELDCRNRDDIELVQFGLMPGFLGQGLGKWFLHWTLDRVWSYGPRRFWLHTCTKDHRAALPNYLKAGFKVYKEEMTQRDIPSAV